MQAYRVLGHHHSSVQNILNHLLSSPLSVAQLLNAVDQQPHTVFEDTVDGDDLWSLQDSARNERFLRSMFSLLYGHCIFPSDEYLIVEVFFPSCEIRKIVSLGSLLPNPDASVFSPGASTRPEKG